MVVMMAGIHISQEIFVIDVLRALKSSLEQCRKHVLRSLQLYGDQAIMYCHFDDRSIQFNFNKWKSGRNRAFYGCWSSPVFLTDILKYRLDRQLNLKCSTIDQNAYFCLIIIFYNCF